MVLKRQNSGDMQDNDKKAGSKFFYEKKKQKTDPWSNFDKDVPDDLKNSLEKGHYGALNGKGSKSSDLNSLSLSSNFDLDSVWSVRKNVPLPSGTKQANQVNIQTGNSHYSRHAGGFTSSQQSKAEEQVNNNESSSSWRLKKPGYSYTSQSSLKRQADENDDDEFDFGDTKKKGNFRSNEGSTNHTNKGSLASLVNPVRKESARTQRAQKMQDAYLRSAGLGSYSKSGQSFNHYNGNGVG